MYAQTKAVTRGSSGGQSLVLLCPSYTKIENKRHAQTGAALLLC